ncbi:hypothetical protein LMG19282_00518 [Cupriavidus campinensis]|uniref:hypothetical protein n=1 Tax=Cupriavidus TaxID=106589 RepID=UPI001B036D8F|nr:hypothetical protein [Cupriavidus campinensis]CAG2131561.1 hypothetical protein LMG19282_00518 [Cupriavidus campinensis]
MLSKSLCAVSLGALLCVPAFAANTQVLLETPVTYAPGAGVVDKVREECQIESMLATRVSDVLRRRNKGGDGKLAAGAEAGEAQVMRLQITHVLGVGGGAWTGPKAITVNAELIEGGKVARHVKLNRWSIGGFWGGFKGTCSILNRSAVALAKDLNRWARDPSYVPKEEVEPPAPTEGQAEPAAEVPADATDAPQAKGTVLE